MKHAKILALTIFATSATVPAFAQFSNFTPIPNSVGAGTLPEAVPFQLGNANWTQVSIADRTTQQAAGQYNTGSWDMIDSNRTGPDAGRYIFTVFETSNAGIQRTDTLTGTTTTIFNGTSVAATSFDASRWTPHGTYLTAEESWGTGSTKGRLFELASPTTATLLNSVVTHRNAVARVSHEGLVFDAQKRMYYVDELNGGSIYRFTSSDPNNTGAGYFSGGVNSVMRVGDGNAFGAVGAMTWIDFTDANGAALPGAITVTPGGVSSVDGRATADLAAFKGTNYNRPEDMEIRTMPNGDQVIYVPTTDAQQVFSINLTTQQVKEFIGRSTINLSTGLAVGSALTSPDNMAIDSQGNLYVIEDQPGGSADIWFINDADNDGVGESMARWATMSTAGAEPTGLYFDVSNPNLAYVNVQHPNSGNDRLIQINSVPEPGSACLLVLGVAGLTLRRRRA